MCDALPHCRIVSGSNRPERASENRSCSGTGPLRGRRVPGPCLRALTLSGCPRMLQVALRACAPQT
ncbi:hypothetical protein GRQ63_26890 [Streptomyces sp. YIM 132580]|nr:hypothetical protein [Streptomyces sp. YIM 132580]